MNLNNNQLLKKQLTKEKQKYFRNKKNLKYLCHKDVTAARITNEGPGEEEGPDICVEGLPDDCDAAPDVEALVDHLREFRIETSKNKCIYVNDEIRFINCY